MSSTRINGGRVYDPIHSVDGVVQDLLIRDGHLVALDDDPVDETIDANGCVVMAGGIDLHSHIGGGKVNLARLLLPEDHRLRGNPIARSENPLELASCGTCSPGTFCSKC